jgi:transposase
MTLDLKAIVNAIQYLLRTGCQWRYLPREYPNCNSMYYHDRKVRRETAPIKCVSKHAETASKSHPRLLEAVMNFC